MAVYLAGKAADSLVLTVFTYDLLMITDALVEAKERGVEVTVIVDRNHTLTGATNFMVDRLSCLEEAGIAVWLSRGISGTVGIQHSETLRADDFLIMGSANWTNSSRLNQEMSLLVHLNEDGLTAYEEKIKAVRALSQPFSDTLEKSGAANRSSRGAGSGATRSASASTVERYATAKRFSIASARTATRAPLED